MGDRAGYTAGPWEFEVDDTSTGKLFTVYDKDGGRVSSTYVNEDQARLIAAAPDLLAALRGLVKVNEDHNESIAKIIGKPLNWKDDYLEAARAAISRATGES